MRPEEVDWRDAPEGKLDLLTTIDFRKNGSSLYSDIVLPTATWYEKHDISSTDMHPFIHPFNPAITPPGRPGDWDIFNCIADVFSGLARTHLGGSADVLAVPLMHDTPDDLAQPGGRCSTGKRRVRAVPGKTMPKLVVIERDYGGCREDAALGPAVENVGITAKASGPLEVRLLSGATARCAAAWAPAGRSSSGPSRSARTILALSGTTNGRLSVEGFTQLEKRTGMKLADLAEAGRGAHHLRRHNEPAAKGDRLARVVRYREPHRRYSPFTINVDRQVPWRTSPAASSSTWTTSGCWSTARVACITGRPCAWPNTPAT